MVSEPRPVTSCCYLMLADTAMGSTSAACAHACRVTGSCIMHDMPPAGLQSVGHWQVPQGYLHASPCAATRCLLVQREQPRAAHSCPLDAYLLATTGGCWVAAGERSMCVRVLSAECRRKQAARGRALTS